MACKTEVHFLSPSFSKAYAACKTDVSSKCLPMIIIPTGSPSEKPALMERVGWPVELNGLVLISIPSDLFIRSENKHK